MLGVYFGSDTQSGKPSGDRANAQSVSEVERLAERLAVPTPGSFAARQIANAFQEFVSHVEADAGGTAHRLAVSYSPEVCQLYKLGAFWGYAMWYASPCRARVLSWRYQSTTTGVRLGCRSH